MVFMCCGSVALLDPFLDKNARSRSSWISWMAHVRLLTFCLRYSFERGAESTIHALVNDYLNKFDAAYGERYCKYKHHAIKHLPKYFR